MNDPLKVLCSRVARLTPRLPLKDAEELLDALIEFAGDEPELLRLRHAGILISESATQLKLIEEQR